VCGVNDADMTTVLLLQDLQIQHSDSAFSKLSRKYSCSVLDIRLGHCLASVLADIAELFLI
jgi:hypothetical protein